jgi:hypothetical protein
MRQLAGTPSYNPEQWGYSLKAGITISERRCRTRKGLLHWASPVPGDDAAPSYGGLLSGALLPP